MSEPVPTTTDEFTMDRVSLVQAILDLENSRTEQVEDPGLAYELSHHIKPYLDRLTALKQGSSETADELDAEAELLEIGRGEAIEEEVSAAGETLVPGVGRTEQAEDTTSEPRQPTKKAPPEGPLPELMSLPPREQARWIFMERFISLEQHEEILGYNLDSEDLNTYQQYLDRIVGNLLLLPRTVEKAENNDIPALQKIFGSTLLVFRNPFIGDQDGNPLPCTIENLRQYYTSYFYKRRKKPNWYESRGFYTEPMGDPHWALCDMEFLNCTLRTPERKLVGYARGWDLPAEYVRQKTVLEDIYDRIICGEALGEDLFATNCNSCTATTYRIRGNKGPLKLVYTAQKAHKIALYGKTGTPHWKATRRFWPGVFPSLVSP